MDAFEVIVICDGDADGSAAACRAIAAELPYRLRILEQDNQGPAAARNRGVTEAQAPLIVFLDDDVVPDEELIATHLNAQAGQEQRVTIGPLLPPPGYRLNAWGAWEERALCRQYDDMAAGRWKPTYRQFYTGNASVLRRHILDAGGFNPSYRRAEDVELALRLRDRGLHFVHLPEARGWHYVRRSFAAWRHMPWAYGAADVAMARANRPEVLQNVAHEYHYRNQAVRTLVWLCAGRPAAVRTASVLLSMLVRGADITGVTLAGTMACSLLFNLCYFDGLAHALGGRMALEMLLYSRRVPAPQPGERDVAEVQR